MSRDNDPAVLLRAASPIDLDSARQLLEEAGIPSVPHFLDFDRIGFGAAHDFVRGGDLLVPRDSLEAARDILRRSWHPPALTRNGLGPPTEPRKP